MNRRNFIKRGGLFVPVAIAFPNIIRAATVPPPLVSSKKATGGGVTPAWHDIETTYAPGDFFSFGGTDYISHPVTLANGGTATKIRLRVINSGTADNLKLALYTAGDALLSSGVVVVGAADDDVYVEATLSPSVSVTATTYKIAAMAEMSGGAGTSYYAKAVAANLDAFVGATYASFPYDPLGSPLFDDLGRKLIAGVWVE